MSITRRTLSRAKMLDWLAGLQKSEAESTLCLPSGALLHTVNLPEEVAKAAENSKTGAVLFHAPGHAYLILPPFPVAEAITESGCVTGPLMAQLKADRKIALVLIRLGSYAIGVCQGERLINSKVGTGLVHSRHRQGGSSSNRFRRHREKQIETFLTRVCGHIREQIEPHARTLDYLEYGGARTTILLLQKQCDFLARLKTPELPPLLDIPDPRQPVLEQAVERVWSSTVLEWREDS